MRCCVCSRITDPVISPSEEARRIIRPGIQELRSVIFQVKGKNPQTGKEVEMERKICGPCLVALYNNFLIIIKTGMYQSLGIQIAQKPSIQQPVAQVIQFPGKDN